VLLVVVFSSFGKTSTANQLAYSTFMHDVKAGEVKTANIDKMTGNIEGTLKAGVSYRTSGPNPPSDLDAKTLVEAGVKLKYVQSSNFFSQYSYFIFMFLMVCGTLFMFSRVARSQMGGMMQIGKSKAQMFDMDKPKKTFADVAGYVGVKREISEVVDFLKNPQRFSDIGAKIPKGVLLVGPPGTGKTLLARAVAGEAGVPFLSVSGSDFMEMFVGVGASRVRDLFQTARKQAPAIIFIDEIDSIGRKRGAGLGGGHDEREQTLNQMLSEMDGFSPTEGVVLMAATNRPDILDPALMRPGRFDRQVVVPLPDLDERLPILEVHAKDTKLAGDVDLSTVAKGTPGMSGADLANLVNEAALHAVRRGSKSVGMEDFESARDRVLMGARRESTVLSPTEKERVAYHEAGHALLAYVLHEADPVHKVSIIPAGMALGVTMQLPLEERQLYPRQRIEDSICVRMGGRIAELLVYGDLSTGAADDLQRNTELARRMVREWGMSEVVGPMAWGGQNQVFLGEDLMQSREYSDELGLRIDEETAIILRAQEQRARELLELHRDGLEAVTKALLEHETIDGALVGKLVDEAHGTPIYDNPVVVQSFTESSPSASTGSAPANWPAPALPDATN
jgi:cell division protease FtsH